MLSLEKLIVKPRFKNYLGTHMKYEDLPVQYASCDKLLCQPPCGLRTVEAIHFCSDLVLTFIVPQTDAEVANKVFVKPGEPGI